MSDEPEGIREIIRDETAAMCDILADAFLSRAHGLGGGLPSGYAPDREQRTTLAQMGDAYREAARRMRARQVREAPAQPMQLPKF